MNDEVVTDDFCIYNDAWLRMKGTRRGFATTTCGDGTNTTKMIDVSCVHPQCFLPPGAWTHFIKTATIMKDFASSCIPKTNFIGVDVCLFELCTCLDYGFEMDI